MFDGLRQNGYGFEYAADGWAGCQFVSGIVLSVGFAFFGKRAVLQDSI